MDPYKSTGTTIVTGLHVGASSVGKVSMLGPLFLDSLSNVIPVCMHMRQNLRRDITTTVTLLMQIVCPRVDQKCYISD